MKFGDPAPKIPSNSVAKNGVSIGPNVRKPLTEQNL